MEKLVIQSSKGNAVTTSLLVAKKFGKEHRHVLEAIRNLITSAENSAVLSMFYKTTYLNSQNKKQPMYIMNRDGFTLLVVGFTGPDALKFKLDYIYAFNRMEEKLNKFDPSKLTRLQLLEMAIEAEKKALALKDKADYADRVVETETRVDIGQAAKILKLPYGRNSFFKQLRARSIFFKNRNEPKQEFIERGYFEMFMILIPTKNHGDLSKPKITVTQKGLYWLAKIFGVDYNDSIPALNAI